MPKKHRNPRLLTKPRSTPPPTLAGSAAPKTSSSSRGEPSSSVNELLTRLRVSSASERKAPGKSYDASKAQSTFHPSLQGIIAEAPPPVYLVPRQRREPFSGSSGTAGPPPPQSWVNRDTHIVKRGNSRIESAKICQRLLTMPGLHQVEEGTLCRQMLLAIARDWRNMFVLEQFYLYEMSSALKSTLLAYIAAYSTWPMDLFGLTTLFRRDDVDDDVEAEDESRVGIIEEDVNHITLAYALGRTLSLKELKRFLLPQTQLNLEDLESWEQAESTSLRFPNLTHLSLAYPGPSISWSTRFLEFVRTCIPTITHLSLAGWPEPPDLATLMLFSKYLLCLRHLDVSDCPTRTIEMLGSLDWGGTWKTVEVVEVGCVRELEEEERVGREEAVEGLRRRIRETRREVKTGVRCRVVG